MTFEEFCVTYVKNAMKEGSMACSCCPVAQQCSDDAYEKYLQEDEDSKESSMESCLDYILRVLSEDNNHVNI